MIARTYIIYRVQRLLAGIVLAGMTFCLPLCAQENFTDHLKRQNNGEGEVSISQDADIESLVNGTSRHTNNSPTQRPRIPRDGIQRGVQADSLGLRDSTERVNQFMTGRRARANGYRIQVFAGGNDRRSKAEAFRMSNVVRSTFDDVPVYTHFVSPRWICRVGDFRTMEEADEMMARMRQTGLFPEATIVKTKITVYY